MSQVSSWVIIHFDGSNLDTNLKNKKNLVTKIVTIINKKL